MSYAKDENDIYFEYFHTDIAKNMCKTIDLANLEFIKKC